MKCPICGGENINQPFKTWNYAIYHVSRYKCSECGEVFNTYASDGISFTIPKGSEVDSTEK